MELFTGAQEGLAGCGMIIVNPPFTLENEARVLLPFLCAALAQNGAAAWTISHFNKV